MLQGFLSIVVELIVPGLVFPGLGAAGLTVPEMVALRLAIPGLVAPYWKVSRFGCSILEGFQVWLLYIGRFPEVLIRYPGEKNRSLGIL